MRGIYPGIPAHGIFAKMSLDLRLHGCAESTSLDRSGEDLLSGGDIDLALHACREGYLAGVIPELQLTHLIPSSRVDPNYLVRLAAGHAVANYHLARLWGWNSGDMQNPILK